MLILVAFLAIGWQARQRTSLDDELTYLALSRSIEHGSYREIYRVTAPLHVQYPPVYPAWLALVRQGVGESHDALRASNLLLVALALLVLYGVARRELGVPLALGFLLLLALNRGILAVGGSILSEGLFLSLSAIALAGTTSAESPDRRRAAWVVAAALAAFLTRMVGIALVLAVGFWLWSKRRWGAFMAWAAASALVVGGWFAYTALARADRTVRTYAGELVGPLNSTGGLILRLARRVWRHSLDYGALELPYSLSVPTLRGTLIDNWMWVGVIVALLSVGLVALWGTWRTVTAYLFFYAGVLLVWTWLDGRLLVAVLPLLLFTLLLGAQRVAGWLPLRARTPMQGALVGLLAFGAGRGVLGRFAEYRECDRANPSASPGCYVDVARSLVAAAGYLRLHAAPADVVLTERPSSLSYLSGLRTENVSLLHGAPTGSAAATLRARNIRFVLLQRLDWPARTLLDSCRDFRVEASFLSEALLLSTTASGATAPDACASLRAFVQALPPDPHANEP